MTAPYIGFNLYLRGALAETWSLVWIPLVLWITDKAILQPKWRVFLTLIIAFISLTHVPSLLICTIFLLLYTISFLFVHPWKAVLSVIGSIFVGFGIASFYLLPAILEKSFINTEIMRSDDIHKLNLLSFGFTETTSIVSRYVQPIFLYNCFVILTFICLIFLFHCHDKLIINKTKKWSIILLILTFLMVDPSLFVWESSKTLQMIQFPWRLLGFFSFGAAVLLGLVVSGISQGKRSLKLVLLSIALVILLGNTLYIHKLSKSLPGFHNPGNIAEAQKKKTWKASIYEQVKVALYDPYTNKVRGPQEYRPLLENGKAVPDPIIGQPPVSVTSGKAEIQLDRWESYERKFNVLATDESTIKLRIYYYPAWHLYVNNQPHSIDMADDGTIATKLPSGFHTVELRYQWTPAFTIGVITSILSLVIAIGYGIHNQIASSIDRRRYET